MASHTAPLSERIAKLQSKTSIASPSTRSPSPGGSVVASDSSLSRAGTLRDKIARFEKKGGVPIPRGSFGLGAPPPHTAGPQRKGELYGIRVPELGKGGTTVIATPSTSRRGSFAEGEAFESPGESGSRSPSPALGRRTRTVSNTSNSSASGPNPNFRRTMHFPGELSDKVRALRHASSIPALADQIDFAAIQRGEDIPPVPTLMPAPVIHENGNANYSPAADADSLSELGQQDKDEPAPLDTSSVQISEAPANAEHALADKSDDSQEIQLPTSPVPAVIVEEVDVRTPLPPPDGDDSRLSSQQTWGSPSLDSELTSVAGTTHEAPDILDERLSHTQTSPTSKKHQFKLEFSNTINDDIAESSGILTPNTMDSFPTPPSTLPRKEAPTPVDLINGEEDNDAPPPLPPKDDVYVHNVPSSRGRAQTRQTLEDESRQSAAQTESTYTRAETPSEHSSAPPQTPPPVRSPASSTGKRAVSPRKPLVVPNWWEDDEDEEVDGGWARVTAVVHTR